MPRNGDDRPGNLVCSFCGKSQDEVRKLIAALRSISVTNV